MIKKRLFAVVMATVMMLSTSVVAFAEDTTTPTDAYGNTGTADASAGTTTWNISSTLTTAVTASGTLKQASIKVTVPTSTEFVINPYKLSAKVGTEDVGTSQIISPSYSIVNEGEVALKVAATVKGEGTNITLATAPVATTSTKKEAFIFVNFQETIDSAAVSALTNNNAVFDANGNLVPTSYTDGGKNYGVDKTQVVKNTSDGTGTTYVLAEGVADLITTTPYAVVTTSKAASNGTGTAKVTYTQVNYKFLKEGEYDKNANQIAVSTKDTTKTDIGTIAAKTADADGGSIAFKILGSTAVNPSTAWTDADTAKVTITFNFTPVVE